MKVVCIDNIKYGVEYRLTIGKIYEVIRSSDDGNSYIIKNDVEYDTWYWEDLFKKIAEIRNEKIDKLLEG